MEQIYPLTSVFIGNQGVYFVLSRLDWQKKRQPCGCLLWWARRDLEPSYVNCFSQSSDPKADLPCPKNRPLIDFAAQNSIRNNNTAPSPVLPVRVMVRSLYTPLAMVLPAKSLTFASLPKDLFQRCITVFLFNSINFVYLFPQHFGRKPTQFDPQ